MPYLASSEPYSSSWASVGSGLAANAKTRNTRFQSMYSFLSFCMPIEDAKGERPSEKRFDFGFSAKFVIRAKIALKEAALKRIGIECAYKLAITRDRKV